MERTLIAFNLPNLITVMIMAAAGYAVLAVFTQLFIKPQGQNLAASGGGF